MVASASRGVTHGNGGEGMVAAADKMWWQTRAEARTTAVGQRGGDGG